MTTILERPITQRGSKPRVACAIYTRVSTYEQGNGASLATQKAECLRYAQGYGLLATHEYTDIQSGLKTDRVNYQRMLRAAREGEFQKIVVWKLDRFGRDRVESGNQLRELQRIGVHVDSATEPNDSPLLRNILMDFAEEESRRISVRVAANKRTRSQDGLRTSKAPWGYRNAPHPGGGVTLEPDADAPVVTECFRRYVTGKHTLMDLVNYIQQAGVSPKRPTTRAGVHHLLRNPTYAGIIRHGAYARYGIQNKSRAERQAEIFDAQGTHPPLIDAETFEQVQRRFFANRRVNGGVHTNSIFNGIIWCQCGSRYTGRNTRQGQQKTYYCTRKNDKGTCVSRGIAQSRLKTIVTTPISALLGMMSENEKRAAVRRDLTAQAESESAADLAAKAGLTEGVSKLEKRLSSLEDGFLDGEIPRERYRARRDELMAQITELRAQLDIQPRPALPDVDQLLALADALEGEPPDDEEWREIIRAVVEKIVVHSDGPTNPATVVITWQPWFEPLLKLLDK